MLTLNVKLRNAKEVSEFKEIMYSYDRIASLTIGGHIIARPLITSSPYITPLDDITINFYGESINEFMRMVHSLDQYITDRQDAYTKTIIDNIHKTVTE